MFLTFGLLPYDADIPFSIFRLPRHLAVHLSNIRKQSTYVSRNSRAIMETLSWYLLEWISLIRGQGITSRVSKHKVCWLFNLRCARIIIIRKTLYRTQKITQNKNFWIIMISSAVLPVLPSGETACFSKTKQLRWYKTLLVCLWFRGLLIKESRGIMYQKSIIAFPWGEKWIN